MPTPPTPPFWTLNASGITPVGSAGQTKLAGCHIIQNAAKTAYQFTDPSFNVLATSPGTSLPTGSFSFPQFTYIFLDWNIGVTGALSSTLGGSGTWSTPGDEHSVEDTGPQNGDYTAQAGGTVVPKVAKA